MIDRRAARCCSQRQNSPAVAVEAERVLSEVNADRLALRRTREGLQAQLARLPVERSRAAEIGKLERLLFDAEAFAFGERLSDDDQGIVSAGHRDLLKAWVDALGPPIFEAQSSTASDGCRYRGR